MLSDASRASALSTGDEPVVLAHGPAWANRYALAPMTNKQSHDDGTLSSDEYRWLVARGRGGFAVVKTCAAYIADMGRTWSGQLGIASAQHLPGLTRLAEGIRATGSRSFVQLHRGGRRADPALAGRLIAPFDDPATGAVRMMIDDVQSMVADFVAAAVRAQQAGFDGVEVHGAHGFLLAQFLDRRNQRQDRYGGALDNRMRALVEVLEGIRAATGDDFQVGVRLSPGKPTAAHSRRVVRLPGRSSRPGWSTSWTCRCGTCSPTRTTEAVDGSSTPSSTFREATRC